MPTAPLVSVLVAVHDGGDYLRPALESVLRQTVSDLELVVVDDGSTDSTPAVLAGFEDPRVRVVRNDGRRGLAGALNRGLDVVQGRYVARMDADDIALPYWLERVLTRLGSKPDVSLVGAGVLEFVSDGGLGKIHLPDAGRAATRWYSLFSSSPFFHNTVAFDRALFERHHLRYDETFGESEDYELWTRVLAHAEADCLEEALVLYRLHPSQASQRRSELQRELGRRVAFTQIAKIAPSLSDRQVELAWRFGYHQSLEAVEVEEAANLYVELLDRFAGTGRYSRTELGRVRRIAARVVARRALSAPDAARVSLLRRAFALDAGLVAHVGARRARRVGERRRIREDAAMVLRPHSSSTDAIRVAAVFPEPTPYRAPLLDRVAALNEIDLTVIYAAPSVVSGRSWAVESEHEAVFLRGLRVPRADRLFRHDYPVTPGVLRALESACPAVVVVSGWSTFAAQVAIAWCRFRRVPYVLLSESHDEGPRPGWRRTVKGAVVPSVVRGASGVLVAGTLARRSMVAHGAQAERVRVFANTIDIEAFGRRADSLAPRRAELRAELGVELDDVVVLSVARLGAEKAHDVLIRAVADTRDPRLVLVLVGEGPEREPLVRLAAEVAARVVFLGDRRWEDIVQCYVAADIFALLSERETWGVVANEAAACGLPLVLSDRVGAAHDLLVDGENGVLVPVGDVPAAASALRRLAADSERRAQMGSRSRELVQSWGYEPSVAGFLAVVREADTGTRR